jgi:hypothetical protein
MEKRTRGCLWAGLGVAVLLVIVGIALAGGAAWLVYQNSSIEQTRPTTEEAEARFEQARARFAGQTPLVTLGTDGVPRAVRRGPPADGSAVGPVATLESFHVMAWKPESNELTQVRLPFWLLRLGGVKGRLSMGEAMQDLDRLGISVEDVERAGPGLLLDHVERSGQRVLVWTE